MSAPQTGGEAAPTSTFTRWAQAQQAAPHALDLFTLLRRIEAAHPQLARLGPARRPADEAVRVSQPAELDFAPAAVSGFDAAAYPLQVRQRVFGLLGPNGPLPLHLTELVRERARTFRDPTLQAFVDLLTHRFTLLFYRAWAQAQPVVELDRGGKSRMYDWLGALVGIGLPGLRERDALGDAAKLHFAGRLGRQQRDADGLLAWCRSVFGVPVSIEPWQGHWMPLQRAERSRLRRRGAQPLGRGVVLGDRVWDVQGKFLVRIGPLSLDKYLGFLPGARELARLRALVRQWVGVELAWDLQVLLLRDQVPPLRLGGAAGGAGALGRSAWLGAYRKPGDADAYVIDVERVFHGRRRRAAAAGVDPSGSSDSFIRTEAVS